MSGQSGTLQTWLSGGLRTVLLPSGVVFRLKVPDVEEMLSKGLIPPALRSIALKFGATGVNPETMDTEGLRELLLFMRTMVAHSLRYVWDGDVADTRWQDAKYVGEPWTPVTVTATMLEEGSIDGDDYAALQGIVTREFTPNQITALSMRDHGLIDAHEADRRIAAEGSATTTGWRDFRREQRGSDAGESGGAVGSATVVDDPGAGKRSGARARARRRSAPATPGG